MTVFIELFPVQTTTDLFAYKPTADEAASPRHATRLSRLADGNWVFADDLLIADVAPGSAGFDLKAESLAPVKKWRETPRVRATFLIRAQTPPLHDMFAQALETPLQGNFRVLQEPSLKPWVVDDRPAVSIGIISRLIYRLDLAAYGKTLADTRGLAGMTVISRVPWVDGRLLNGVVTSVSGTVGAMRDQLLRYATDKSEIKRLERAPDSEPVVRVQSYAGAYDYAASSLWIALSAKDYARLRVNPEEAQKASYQNIADRAKAVAAASSVLKAMDYIGDAYNDTAGDSRFLSASDLNFSAQISLGDQVPRNYAPRKLPGQMRSDGLYAPVPTDVPLQIGIMNALGTESPEAMDQQIIQSLSELGVPLAEPRTATGGALTADAATHLVGELDGINAALVLLPGSEPGPFDRDVDWEPFIYIKSALLRAGLPSICFFLGDMRYQSAAAEAAVATVSAFGGTPFGLGKPLSYANHVVGFLLMGQTVHASVYGNNGAFIGYILHDGVLDAEGAAHLLPETFFGNSTVLVHHTDSLDDAQRESLQAWAKKHKITLRTVHVGAGGNPRIYATSKRGIVQPPTGTAFCATEKTALFIPALPPHPAMPPNPLHLQTEAGFPIELAMHSVLAMNTLHPQARKPRLPVTLNHHERVRRLLRAGVRPAHPEGALPWWC